MTGSEGRTRRVAPNKSRVYLTVKRAVDIAGSAAGMLVLSPLLLLVALLIYLDNPGPVLYAQERAGMNNRKFVMYKFRSMVPDAEKQHADLLRYNEMEGPVFKMKDDPRITKIGRFIRKTSIDELPQLINVLRGEMSLVGPRPLAAYESRNLDEYQLQRLLVRPGITCFWQISGRNDISFDRWIEMDLDYIEQASLKTDAVILLRTVKAVLVGRGAY